MPMGMFPVMAIVALAVCGGICMVWMVMSRQSRVEAHPGRAEIEQLSDAVEELRADVDAVRGELTEVQERLDFAERLLTRGSGARSSESG